ncbi:SurA N-terminal domain-containing protein [Candidatus Gottesmanbacteria bacterium]|nr:SurA N-terminal domain-containing protein [Candidatus Gottesmanbacteria bacterium]
MPSKVKKLFRDDVTSMPSMPSETPMWRKPYSLALGVLILGLVILFFTNKGLFVAAVVNGKPIFRWDLNKVLVSRFGKQTLEGIISETLIADAAKKSGVVISQQDIDGKVGEIMKGLGGNVKLEDLLAYQGMSKADFETQIRMQLTIREVLGKDIAITENDIDTYIATSRALLAATEPGELRKEAQNAIMDAKVGEKLQTWFSELKEKAKILRFL